MIVTSASVINIEAEDLPVHQVAALGIATAVEMAVVNEHGVQVKWPFRSIYLKS